jgi:hypothetical protein
VASLKVVIVAYVMTVFSRLTREEREEAYNRARQRIFGSVENTENSKQGRFNARLPVSLY